MGKTALVDHFLDQVDEDEVLVLRGRCSERESLPFRALDGLLDEVQSLRARVNALEGGGADTGNGRERAGAGDERDDETSETAEGKC